MKKMTVSLSKQIYEKMCDVIPGGVNSPVRSFKMLEMTPIVAESGKGENVVDADGNSFIDYCGSWGALIHGHAHPQIIEAAAKRLAMGSTFGMTTAIEGKFAEKIVNLMPSVEKIRFVSSGTEATMSAVRLARGFTNREIIVKFSGHYHGHSDAFLVQAGSGVANLQGSMSKGVPFAFIKNTICLSFNDFEAVERLFKEKGNQIACVILEPIAANMGVVLPKTGYLELLRHLTEMHGSLLIFDEVITGFRVGLGGAQKLYGIKPDLTCLGKIIGGGFPAAAFGGKKEIMDKLAPLGPIYQAGTLSGNPVAMEAGFVSLNLCEKPNFYQTLQEKTDTLLDPLKDLISDNNLNMCIQDIGSMFTIFFGRRSVSNFEESKQCDSKQFGIFFKKMLENGIYLSPSSLEAHFISNAHDTNVSLPSFFKTLQHWI